VAWFGGKAAIDAWFAADVASQQAAALALAASGAASATASDVIWSVRKADTREVDRIARDLGIPRELVRNALERIKKAARWRGDVIVEPDGTVRDDVNGDELGNIHDDACSKR